MNENATQTYRRRSSSILKQPKSPREALQLLDNDTVKQVNQEGKKSNMERHSSRRVSFADTCQVQEFCKENFNSELSSPDVRIVPECPMNAITSVLPDVPAESVLPAHHSLLTGQILYLPIPITDSTNESKTSLVESSACNVQETRKRIPLSVLNPDELEREACERNDEVFCGEALLDSTFITSPVLEINNIGEGEPKFNHRDFGALNRTCYMSESNNDMELTNVSNISIECHLGAPSSFQALSKTLYCNEQNEEMDFTKVSNFTIDMANKDPMEFSNVRTNSDRSVIPGEIFDGNLPMLNNTESAPNDSKIEDMELTEIDTSNQISHHEIDPAVVLPVGPNAGHLNKSVDRSSAPQSVLDRSEIKEQQIKPPSQLENSLQNGCEEMEFTNVEDSMIVVSQKELLKGEMMPALWMEMNKNQVESIPNNFLAPNPVNLPCSADLGVNIPSPVPREKILLKARSDLNNFESFTSIVSPSGPLPVCSTAREGSDPSRFSISMMDISAENSKNAELELVCLSGNPHELPEKISPGSSTCNPSHGRDDKKPEIYKLKGPSSEMVLTKCGTTDTVPLETTEDFRNLSTMIFEGSSANMQLTNCATASSGWRKTARASGGCKSLLASDEPSSLNSRSKVLASANKNASTSEPPFRSCADENNEPRNPSGNVFLLKQNETSAAASTRIQSAVVQQIENGETGLTTEIAAALKHCQPSSGNSNTGIVTPNIVSCKTSNVDKESTYSFLNTGGSNVQKDAGESRVNQKFATVEEVSNLSLARDSGKIIVGTENIEPSVGREDNRGDKQLMPLGNLQCKILNTTTSAKTPQQKSAKRVSPQKEAQDDVPCKKVMKNVQSDPPSVPQRSTFNLPNLPMFRSTMRTPVQYGFSRPWKLNRNDDQNTETHRHVAHAGDLPGEACGDETEAAPLDVGVEESFGNVTEAAVVSCADSESNCEDIDNIRPSLVDDSSLNISIEESVTDPAEKYLCPNKRGDIPGAMPEEELCGSNESPAERSQVLTDEMSVAPHETAVEESDENPGIACGKEENSSKGYRGNVQTVHAAVGKQSMPEKAALQLRSQTYQSRLNFLMGEAQQMPRNADGCPNERTLMGTKKLDEVEDLVADTRATTNSVGGMNSRHSGKRKKNIVPIHQMSGSKLLPKEKQELLQTPQKQAEIQARIDAVISKRIGATEKMNSQAIDNGGEFYSGHTANAADEFQSQVDKAKTLMDSKQNVASNKICSSEWDDFSKKVQAQSKSRTALREGMEELKANVKDNLENDDEAWKDIISKLKPVEPVVNKIIKNVSKTKCEYNIKEWTSQCIHLSFWKNGLHLKFDLGDVISKETVGFGFDEEKREIREILAVRQWTLVKDDFEPIRKWAHQTMWRAFEKEGIVSKCKTTLQLHQILPTLCMYSSDSRMLYLDADRARFMHFFEIQENTITIEFVNSKAVINFKLAFTVKPGTYPNRRLPAKLEVLFGEVSEDEVFSVLRSIEPGQLYLYNLVKAVDNWLQSKPYKA